MRWSWVKVSITSGCHIYFITVTPAERQIQEYTIQYKANGEVINGTEKTKTGFVGDPVEVTEEDKAEFSITDGDVTTTYTYSEDDSEGMTIAADGTTVVTIKMTATQKRVNTLYSWDFSNWSEETVNNLKAGDNWSDIEKADGTNPTDGNCFWLVSTELDGNNFLKANNTVIEDLKGLAYTYEQDTRNLAIAVNYPETSLGVYSGPSYLWLGGAKINYFKILSVPAGATIKMGVESHKNGDPRGVQLSVNKTTLTAPDGSTVEVPTTYTEQEWLVPADAAETNDVQIYNTNGCHIYYIKVTHPELQKYTLRYVAGDEIVKEVVKFGTPDSAITLADADKAEFSVTANGYITSYTCGSDDSKGKTVNEDGSAVVIINVTKGNSLPVGYMVIPGELDINHSSWKLDGTIKKENDNTNIGSIRNNATATGKVYVAEPGVYSMNIDFYWWKTACDMRIEITDEESGEKEVDTYYYIPNKHEANILLEGTLTEGKKTIKYSFLSNSSEYLVNYRNQTITKVGETYAALKSVTGEGISAVETEGYDFSFNIPADYEGETVSLKAELLNAALNVKAGETVIPVSAEGVFELPVPTANEASEADLTLTLGEGAYAGQTEFKLRLFHVGEVVLSGLTFDGLAVDEEAIATLQSEKKEVTIDGYVFTSLPKVEAIFKDGSVVEATGTLADDQKTATFAFQGKAGSLTEDYSFTLSGFHIYQPSENDKTDVLKYEKQYQNEDKDGSWSNDRYTISCNDGWDGKQFKMKSTTPTTLTAPGNMVVKQIKMACLFDNYSPGKVASVTSEGATVYLPSASDDVSDAPRGNRADGFIDHPEDQFPADVDSRLKKLKPLIS